MNDDQLDLDLDFDDHLEGPWRLEYDADMASISPACLWRVITDWPVVGGLL